jgi:lipopolysaccharide biosynthesis protein
MNQQVADQVTDSASRGVELKNRRSDAQVVVVLGMHRSGTSVLTSGLQVLGINLGEAFVEPTPDNPRGYWEHRAIVGLNERILHTLGMDWDSICPVTWPREHDQATSALEAEALLLLQRAIGDGRLFGFKDPRTVRLLPFWQRVFKRLGLEDSYVIALRNPKSVADSLYARDRIPYEHSYLLWLEHMLPALSLTHGHKRVVVDFDDFLLAPERQLARIGKVMGLAVDAERLRVFTSEVLSEDLRHRHSSPQDLARDPRVSPVVVAAYDCLLKLARDEIGSDDSAVRNAWSGLDTLLQSFAPFLQHFHRLKYDSSRGEHDLEQVSKLRASVAQLKDELHRAITLRDAEIATLHGTLAERDQRVAEREQQIAALNGAVAERELQIATLNVTLVEREDRIAQILRSTSWQITAPLRLVSSRLRKAVHLFRALRGFVRSQGGIWSIAVKLARILQKEGAAGITRRLELRLIFRSETAIAPTASGDTASRPDPKLAVVPYYIDPLSDSSGETVSTAVPIGIHLHLYYPEMLGDFISHLASIPVQYDLLVSVPESSEPREIREELKAALPNAGRVLVEPVPNRGRDIAPLIVQFGERLSRYEIIAHLHTKRSPHHFGLSGWCKEILELLIGPVGGSGGRVAHIIALLQSTAKIVYPEGQNRIIKDRTGWADDRELARYLLARYTRLSVDDFPVIDFPEGSMFWARSECLKEFLALPLKWEDFPREPIPADGTLAHALERLILVFASTHQGHSLRLHRGDSISDYRHYEERRDYSSSIVRPDVRVLSYYLPQFHPIPENDAWHGKGFTEWTKVKAANPLFEGHYQQHIPHPDIGYYLLESPETLRRQAEMMRHAGIHGQIFYHYWFTGKLILEQPAGLLLENPDIRMPYCFCWANENWTRRWDGNENEILLRQDYSAEDARAFIQYLIPFFRDARYIRVEGRPVLFVYRPSSLPNAQEYLDIWKSECAQAGINRPYVVGVLTRGATDPREFGMDAGAERVLHDWTAGAVSDIKGSLRPYHAPITGSVLTYGQVMQFYSSQKAAKEFTFFRSLVPGWDNTPRYGAEAYLLHGSTPQLFQHWLESVIAQTKSTLPEDRRFVLINAWNEWAEGAHLEPDSRFGYSYLNSVGRALSGIAYGSDLNASATLESDLRVHLSFPQFVLTQLHGDADLRRRFIHCLSRSTIFRACQVSLDAPLVSDDVSRLVQIRKEGALDADYLLQFRRIAFFEPDVIEKLVGTARNTPGSVILSNAYDRHTALMKITENGSVESFCAYSAPLVLFPSALAKHGYKNFRVRTDARTFVSYPNTVPKQRLPAVTAIVRFHKSADLDSLRHALYSLAAMQDCLVTPLVAAQDLSDEQRAELEGLVNSLPWAAGVQPLVHFYQSRDGTGDLRSTMLNESLRRTTTRYAAFLDYDDLLMSNAYGWLIGRLKETGKAISFGRVYATTYRGATGQLIERSRLYEYGDSYDDFLRHNHAPLHSFMLDLERLDVSHVTYFADQRYLEDYYLTLQLVTRDNADWDGLTRNVYIGDYIHAVDRPHTLATLEGPERDAILSSTAYRLCEQRIQALRESLAQASAA